MEIPYSLNDFVNARFVYPIPSSDAPHDCPICLEPYATQPYNAQSPQTQEDDDLSHIHFPVRLEKCGHVFGFPCLAAWTSSGNTCPLCRAVLYFRLLPSIPNRLWAELDDNLIFLLIDGYHDDDTPFEIQSAMWDALTHHLSQYDTDQLLAVFQYSPLDLPVPDDIDISLALIPESVRFLGINGLLTVGILDWFRHSVVVWYWNAWEDLIDMFWDQWEEVEEEGWEGWEE